MLTTHLQLRGGGAADGAASHGTNCEDSSLLALFSDGPVAATTTTIDCTEEDANEADDEHTTASAATNTQSILSCNNDITIDQDGESRTEETTTTTTTNNNNNNTTTTGSKTNENEIKAAAALLRAQGKERHDAGDYVEAATRFASAADLLQPYCKDDNVSTDGGTTTTNSNSLAELFATCRLHQALCCLKSHQYQAVVAACTQVLELPQAAAAVRARAGLRRAKAHLALEQPARALEDARQAAFWGDRKAVALYGQLMRRNNGNSMNGNGIMETTAAAKDPSNNNNNNNAALLESLLSKSLPSSPFESSSSSSAAFSPASLLQGALGGGHNGGGGGAGGATLAKSVLQSLSKKLDDENTQHQIVGYLQSCNGPMLQTVARLAGIPLPEDQAARLADLARAVTVKRLRRGVHTVQRIAYAVQLLRKLGKVLYKYRPWLILCVFLTWTKSAVLRPLPVSRRHAAAAAAPTPSASTGRATPLSPSPSSSVPVLLRR